MEFKSAKKVYDFLKKCTYLDEGSQGKCYVDKDRKLVYKLYFTFLDPYEDDIILDKNEVLAFSEIKSDMYLFPRDVLTLSGEVIGDITKYVNATNLYKINPLTINLNHFLKLCELAVKEVELIARQGILTFDIMYNMLLGDKLYIVDALDYTKSSLSYQEILRKNLKQFNLGIMYFLTSGLFEKVVGSNRLLCEMYKTTGEDMSIIYFIKELKRYLSEIMGQEVINLGDAQSLVNESKQEACYMRLLEL